MCPDPRRGERRMCGAAAARRPSNGSRCDRPGGDFDAPESEWIDALNGSDGPWTAQSHGRQSLNARLSWRRMPVQAARADRVHLPEASLSSIAPAVRRSSRAGDEAPARRGLAAATPSLHHHPGPRGRGRRRVRRMGVHVVHARWTHLRRWQQQRPRGIGRRWIPPRTERVVTCRDEEQRGSMSPPPCLRAVHTSHGSDL